MKDTSACPPRWAQTPLTAASGNVRYTFDPARPSSCRGLLDLRRTALVFRHRDTSFRQNAEFLYHKTPESPFPAETYAKSRVFQGLRKQGSSDAIWGQTGHPN
jgi:hypothetical protein